MHTSIWKLQNAGIMQSKTTTSFKTGTWSLNNSVSSICHSHSFNQEILMFVACKWFHWISPEDSEKPAIR